MTDCIDAVVYNHELEIPNLMWVKQCHNHPRLGMVYLYHLYIYGDDYMGGL